MAFLKTVVTPAGVPAVHERVLAGALEHYDPNTVSGLGQFEWVSDLPALIKSGGDVAANIYRAVNYDPITYPTGYTSPGMIGGVGAMPFGLSPTTLLILGGGLLAFMMLRK